MTYDIQVTDKAIYAIVSGIITLWIVSAISRSDRKEKEEKKIAKENQLKSYREIGFAAGILNEECPFHIEAHGTEQMIEWHKGYYEGLRLSKIGDPGITLEKQKD